MTVKAIVERKPWLQHSDGWIVCAMCPTDKDDRDGNVLFRGLNLNRCSRRQAYRFLKSHRHCGFRT